METINASKIVNLHFKWTISKGRDTYGYNICTLLVDGAKKGQCNGGGYDMQGTSFAQWLASDFQTQLLGLFAAEFDKLQADDTARTYTKDNGKIVKYTSNVTGFYGVTLYIIDGKRRVELDGACGMSSIQEVAKAIGITLKWNKESDRYRNHTYYTGIIN